MSVSDHLLVTCCRPLVLTGPSGRHLSHSRYCSEFPGLRITRATARDLEHLERMAQIFVRPKLEPLEPDGPHTPGRLTTWNAHRPGCPCEVCRYVDSHLDDLDD